MTRVLATTIVLGGQVFEAGDIPPASIAARIRNPSCWKTLTVDEPAPPVGGGAAEQAAAGPSLVHEPVATQLLQREVVIRPPVTPADEDDPQGSATTSAGIDPVTPEEPLEEVELVGDPDVEQTPVVDDAPELDEDEDDDQADTAPVAGPVPPRAGAGSGRPVWQAFASRNGVDHPADATRDEIIDACQQAGVI